MTDISTPKPPKNASAVIVLADGSVFYGQGIGAQTKTVGEICFNTSMTGYQEILTDPSYAGQIINFTFPHIGNVGTNDEDIEAATDPRLERLMRDGSDRIREMAAILVARAGVAAARSGAGRL